MTDKMFSIAVQRFPGFIFPCLKEIRDSLACMPIPVGIAGLRHSLIGIFFFEKFFKVAVDDFFVCPYQPESTCLDSFRSLCSIPHDKNRFSIGRALLLDPAGIRQAEEAPGFKIMAVKDLNRFYNVDPLASAQFFLCRPAHNRIHMDRIDRPAVRMLVKNPADGAEHLMHGLAQIFPAVSRDKDHFVISDPVQFRMRVIPADCVLHGIYDGIPGNMYGRGILALSDQILSGHVCRREIVPADNADRLSVEFFGVRTVDIVGPKAGFHVPDRYLQIASGLPYRDYMTVGVLIPHLNLKNETKTKTMGNIVPDNWVYVHDRNVKMGRFQIYNNWSPYMVKNIENTVWMGLEYFCNEGDDMWSMTDSDFAQMAVKEMVTMGLIDSESDVLDSHVERVKKAYPAYFDTYEHMDELRGYLDTIPNLFCVGRNGQHRYNNIDHSMCTSFEAVKNILSGDTKKDNIWNVNTEKEYHEEKES